MAEPLTERFRAFAQNPNATAFEAAAPTESLAELEAALLVTAAIDPNVDEAAVRGQWAALIAELDTACEPWDALSALGFTGNRDNYRDLANSALDQVLARRTGIPISLGAVLIGAARASGRAAVGINHPGHFLVRVGATLVDPFAMAPVSMATAERESAERLPGITAVEFALRMLNNLKYFYSTEQIWDQALTMVGYQLALVPEHPHLWAEKGEFWSRLGANAAAADAYRQALVFAADAPAELVAKLRKRLAGLAGAQSETLH